MGSTPAMKGSKTRGVGRCGACADVASKPPPTQHQQLNHSFNSGGRPGRGNFVACRAARVQSPQWEQTSAGRADRGGERGLRGQAQQLRWALQHGMKPTWGQPEAREGNSNTVELHRVGERCTERAVLKERSKRPHSLPARLKYASCSGE
jgi:hypothetical protein